MQGIDAPNAAMPAAPTYVPLYRKRRRRGPLPLLLGVVFVVLSTALVLLKAWLVHQQGPAPAAETLAAGSSDGSGPVALQVDDSGRMTLTR